MSTFAILKLPRELQNEILSYVSRFFYFYISGAIKCFGCVDVVLLAPSHLEPFKGTMLQDKEYIATADHFLRSHDLRI